MSATSARAAGPEVVELEAAKAAPRSMEIATDAAATDVANEKVTEADTAEEATENAAEPEEKAVEVAQPVGGIPLAEEDAAERHKALTLARIQMSSAPGAVKERFAELAEAASNAATVEACLKAVEDALPAFLHTNELLSGLAPTARQGEHPAGEVFFRGDAEEITDEQAEEMARRQLERSGLLRGQRVRVAD